MKNKTIKLRNDDSERGGDGAKGDGENGSLGSHFLRPPLAPKHPGIVFSKEQIYDIVWKEAYSGDYNIVMSHIRNIREKIEDNPSKPIYIQTVWGVGYRFNKNLIA